VAAALNASKSATIMGLVHPLSFAGSFMVSVRTPFLLLVSTSGALVAVAPLVSCLALDGRTKTTVALRRAASRSVILKPDIVQYTRNTGIVRY
jgi:hypothetical protein